MATFVQVLSDIALDVASTFSSPESQSVALERWASDTLSGYQPVKVPCPAQRPRIRAASTISPQEREWLYRRRRQTIPHIRDLFRRIDIPGFNSDRYLQADRRSTSLPNIGIAISGGGYRAMLTGAGTLSAWDSRTQNSMGRGGLGGLLQSTTYLSGLSGGSWLVGSIYANNFTSIQQTLQSSTTWRLETNLLGYTTSSKSFGANLVACKSWPARLVSLSRFAVIADVLCASAASSIKDRLKEIIATVMQKNKAGFATSLADYWGRAISYQIIDAPGGGPGLTFSSVASQPSFASGNWPLPLIVAVGASPGLSPLPINSTSFEFSPWEMGSYDDSLNGFAPLKYVGSRFETGTVPPNEQCVNGFDNIGFVMGSSSFLFNQALDGLKKPDPSGTVIPSSLTRNPTFKALRPKISQLINFLSSIVSLEGAFWAPNPFKGWNLYGNPTARSDRLSLVDGAEDGQTIPVQPHLITDRQVDVVFAVDAAADTQLNWPNGEALVGTYRRSVQLRSRKMGFPSVPGQDTFVNLGLNARPTFFGCDAANLTAPSPLIIYLPNAPYLTFSNVSTLTKLAFSPDERDALIENGRAMATQLNSALDPNWPVCVGCAILSRSFDRTGLRVPDSCRKCFRKYCWNGQIDEREPALYQPSVLSLRNMS
ncbi:hypothetical protein XA68_10148 [Ophiocordyceps unilateralis]|uniref:Lysophospholipase n=1 Tax=Ophiocordyceps unilateralis TaxID=268505 RepID=A0A2A9PJ43_OPHUN|nr:hypothetical protein XA68_10148 [Ophiocordyceps unilateralis]